MRLDAFLLSDHAAVAEGKLYVNGGGITRLNVPVIPFVMPTLSVLVRYLVEGPEDFGEHSMALRLETPSGVNLLPEEPVGSMIVARAPAAVDDEEHFLQMSLNFSGVPIIEKGVHLLSAFLDDELTRQMTLPVVLVEGGVIAPPPNRAERRRQERAAQRGRAK